LPGLISIFRAFARALGRPATLRRRQIDTRPTRFGEADRDRLFRRASTVLATPDLVDFLMHEFACLRRR